MRSAILTVEPVAGALRFRLDRPEPGVVEPLAREYRQPIDATTLRALTETASTLFHAAARPGFADDARRTGTMLHRTLVPEALREPLRGYRGPLVVASSSTDVPWALVHDGEEFWGLRYPLGTRLVHERPAAVREPARRHDRLRALVVGADPLGDLPHVTAELDAVCDALEPRADVVCVAGRLATVERVLALLGEGFDVVHFAGHVVRDDAGTPALLLADRRPLSARLVETNLVGRPLVVVNGCTSGYTATAAGIADAFLQGGALAVVGTIADVADAPAAALAATFHREALGGAPIGSALREARAQVRETTPESPAWLSHVLYGDPALRLRDATPTVVPLRPAAPAAPVAPRTAQRWPWAVLAVLVALAIAIGVVRTRHASEAGRVAVGVMDVRARGDGVPDWMRTLTRDSLNTVLSRVPEVQVYSRQKIEFLREKRGLTDIEAAETLGMTKLLGASVGVDGPDVTLDVEVVDIATGVLQETASVRGPQTDLLALETELALRVLTALGIHPSDEELRALVAERKDATVDAYRLLTDTFGRGAPPKPASPPSTTAPTTGPGAWWLVPGRAAYAQAPDRDEADIRALFERYAAAIQAKDTAALAALQLDMDDAQRASLARYFAIANDLRVRVRDVDPLVEGDDAVVTFTREDTFTDAPSGRAMHLEVRVSGRLVRQADGWKIKSLGDRS